MSKEYNVKYEVGQEVYVLRNKEITRTIIEKIRVTEQQPHTRGTGNGTHIKMTGITIDYLIEERRISFGVNSTQSVYNWYSQEDVFTDKDELIAQIL